MLVIINADDLGYSSEVNESICDLMERKRISSATVIANSPTIEEAVRMTKGFKTCSFGIHLNLTEFRPLSRHSRLRPLLNEAGEFGNSIRAVWIGPAMMRAIFDEWCAQVDQAIRLGLVISHIDSHHHVHTIPTLFPVLKRLQQRYGLTRVRRTKDLWPVSERPSHPFRLKKSTWNFALRHTYPRTRTTASFTSFRDFTACIDENIFLPRSIELMCHPGSHKYIEETSSLFSEWQFKLNRDVQLISYHEI